MNKKVSPEQAPLHWHAIPPEEVLEIFDSSASGLSADSAAARLLQYGPNQLPETKPRGPLLRFLLQFHNVLIYVLLAAALVTAALQHWLDTAVIVGVVVVKRRRHVRLVPDAGGVHPDLVDVRAAVVVPRADLDAKRSFVDGADLREDLRDRLQHFEGRRHVADDD